MNRPLVLLLLASGIAAACDGDVPPPEPPLGTFAIAADPSAKLGLVGGDVASACSHQPREAGGSADRWCAFFKQPREGGAELWVVNLTRVRAGDAPCDGSSPHCLRLSTHLWTGSPPFAPGHPFVHGFFGDTLFFYTDALPAGADEQFTGLVQAWRPGMKQGRVVSGPRGFYCFSHERAAAAICISNQSREGGVGAFDLLGGPVEGGTVGALPLIERVRWFDDEGATNWRVGFSPTGTHFALSTKLDANATPAAAATAVTRLRVVAIERLGSEAPKEIMRDLEGWSFTPDGRKLVFLRGLARGLDGERIGTLMAADFPDGGNPGELAPAVGSYELFGAPGGPNRGAGLFQQGVGADGLPLRAFRVMPDLSRPGEVTTIATDVEDVVVSSDARHSFFQTSDGMTSVSVIARNDGSGRCRINQHDDSNAFFVRFEPRQRRVFWAEDVQDASGRNRTEGWYADPETCGGARRFSQDLGYMQPTARGLIWGDVDATVAFMALRHARVAADGSGLVLEEAEEIVANAGLMTSVVDGRNLVFGVEREGGALAPGLYLHGPLP